MHDLILLYKIIHGLVDIDADDLISLNQNHTRGHSLKLNIEFARLNCRKFSFFNRTIPIWNSLSEDHVNSTSVKSFRKSIEAANLPIYCRGQAHTAN